MAQLFKMGSAEVNLNWDHEPVRYKHFTDMGNYCIRMEDADYSQYDKIAPTLYAMSDVFRPCCTASVKKNKKGEVIVGRNMDVEVSQNPAYLTRVTGGKYDTIAFTYPGKGGRYAYSRLTEMDADETYLQTIPYQATDAMNEKGLYIEANMREEDSEISIYCPGTNPGKTRACVLSAPVLIALNCATVEEAIAFLNNSYDWYTGGLNVMGEGQPKSMWNLAFVIGDACGNYGLIELAMNKVFYTPYANGQGNYYIHPELAEYARYGTGYGRFAAALRGLPACETEWDMLHNMEACMWKKEILEPGCLGYSDLDNDVIGRRARSKEEMQEAFDAKMAPLQPLAKAYYAGDETPLRDNASVWTTSFNYGVNCAARHLILRLWEKDTAIVECRW